MRLYRKEEAPPYIKVDIKSSDRRKRKETFNVTGTTMEDLFLYFYEVCAQMSGPKTEEEKATLSLREYNNKELGKQKNITVYGHDPMILSAILQNKIKSLTEVKRSII